MPSVKQWQAELYEMADRLEAGATKWALPKDVRDDFAAAAESYHQGTAPTEAPRRL